MPIIAPKLRDVEKLTPLQNYMMDIMTCGPNLAGLPHMSINAGESNGLPVGLLMVGNHMDEEKLIQLGSFLEENK